MAGRVDVLLPGLLKFLLDVSSDADLHPRLQETLMSRAALCLRLLDCCCHGNLQVSSPADAPVQQV